MSRTDDKDQEEDFIIVADLKQIKIVSDWTKRIEANNTKGIILQV
jgi:hypothetical protein